mgnify:CR=1 FL=1
MNQKPLLILLFIIFINSFGFCDDKLSPFPADMQLLTTEMDTIFFQDIVDKENPTFVYFWATWCHVCGRDIPKLEALENEYKGKINFISIAYKDSKVTVESIITKQPKYMPTYIDAIDNVFEGIPIKATPTIFILDKNLDIVYSGYANKRSYKKIFNKLLNM